MPRGSFESQITMAMDAMCHSSKEILSRVFDGVVVSVQRERGEPWCWRGYRDVIVTVSVIHRGRQINREERFDSHLASDPEFYCQYLRECMPADVAHKITDFILRNPSNASQSNQHRPTYQESRSIKRSTVDPSRCWDHFKRVDACPICLARYR